jgi:hypothetical protein
MKRETGLSLARYLAMIAIVLQAVLPGSIVVAEANGVDVSRFICAPSGEMSRESKVAAERIARLLGEDLPEETPFDGHCPLCTLVHGVPLPEPVIFAGPTALPVKLLFVRYEPGLVRKAQGPPLGSRGPPSHI